MRKIYCMKCLKIDKGTAGAKAPADVSQIATNLGSGEIPFYEAKRFNSLRLTRLFSLFTGIKNWCRLIKTVEKGALIIIQHPYENIVVANKMIRWCKKYRKYKFVALIHDLNSVRTSLLHADNIMMKKRDLVADDVLLKKYDYIIVHNEKMKDLLMNRGFEEKQLVTLGIFDYLHNCEISKEKKYDRSVVIAGNLMPQKCSYLYSLLKIGTLPFSLHLYGPGLAIDVSNREDVIYHGVVKAEELPEKLEGSFGLVWDGESIDTCAGNAGEYLRYNNPHKTSLYLSSGIPVIIWKEAALSEFILKNDIGVVVDKFEDIGNILDIMTEENYENMRKKVGKIGNQLRTGSYLMAALKEITK